ncbi:non-ribosomal peptide synthetase [Kitasatospora mediocidica]|uniref:non-ribosomal peptide synthetase n=1 Tax=Kitasatospora mediocidica TaxID=58352 RepID=UPI000692416A|nr:non-ribosomal peptide synthetase [Kitasatospora mediocidica]
MYRLPDTLRGAVPTTAGLWTETVAGPADGGCATRRLADELCAPLGAAPSRLVLLEYGDGARDLVVSADPARIDRPAMDRLADAVLGAAHPDATAAGRRVPPPGDSTVDVLPVPLPDLRTGAWEDLLAATLGVVLARTFVSRAPVLELADGRTVPLPAEQDEDRPVAAYRALAATPVTPELPDGPGTRVLLLVDRHPARAELTHYRPPLDRRHAVTVHAAPDAAGRPVLTCWHRPGEFSGSSARTLASQLAQVAAELTTSAQERPLSEVDVHGAAERRRIVELGRTPRTAVQRTGALHEQVLARAKATPDAIAVVDGDSTLSYGQLAERAGRMANALRALGVAPRDRVGVCLERTSELIVVLLAVMTAGAAYVPLDPTYPAERLAYTAQDAALGIVLVDSQEPSPFDPGVAVPLARLSELAELQDATPPATGVGAADPAYVIYTSGSTGRPKGVVIPHSNVPSLLAATEDDFGLGPSDVWPWFHSAAFDVSVWEIWGCLLTGGRVVVVPYWTCRSPEDFRALLLRERVTVLTQTPSAFAGLFELERAGRTPLALRLVVFAGEPLDTRSLTDWFDAHPESECRVVNMFGITETTVHTTAQTVTRAEALAGSRSVGRAIPGWALRVLDSRGRLLAPGAPGEIAVAGDGLALHYLGQPELTDRRFVADPDGDGRLYLSGDLGVLLPDGGLEHLGRLDDQVKIRGYRIELGEVRNVLLGHPAVVAAAVVVGRDQDANVRLDAYLVLDGAEPAEVRRYVAGILPEYMMPGTVTRVDQLPLTVNGKLDKSRLPAPMTAPAQASAVTVDAATGVLGEVLAVWRELFHPGVEPEDDFFSLGGNSLLALRIVRLLRERAVVVTVRDVYRLLTPAALAGAATRAA